LLPWLTLSRFICYKRYLSPRLFATEPPKVPLWARGYFAANTGNVTDEIIKQYIESQEQGDESGDDNFKFGCGLQTTLVVIQATG
jgi:hypothetical protein